MNKKMCLLMATVVTVNSIATVAAPVVRELGNEVEITQEAIVTTGSALSVTTEAAIQINQPYSVKVVRQNRIQLQGTESLVAPITWESNNKHIATVDGNGLVTALEKGFSIIKAVDDKGTELTWKVDVMYMDEADIPEVDASVYTELRQVWLGTLIGMQNDVSSENIKRVITRVNDFTKKHLKALNTAGGPVFNDDKTQNYAKDPAHTREMYLRLEWIAKGYSMKESDFYKEPEVLEAIKYSLEWLYQNAYGIQKQYGNWWQWEIGIPKALNNICIMLFDELGQELVNKYTDVIYFHQPDPFHSGASGVSANPYRESEAANRVDVSLVSLVMGILRGDYEQLIMTRDAIGSLLKYEERNSDGTYQDGFYTDGSFIQHGHVPYVGTYGNVFLTGASTVAKALQDTPWEVTTDKLEILTEFGMEAFAPFIYKGAALDMVRGRAVARAKETDRKSGHNIMGSFLLLSEVVEPELGQKLKSYAKTWITEDTSVVFAENTNNIQLINLAEEILNDESIEAVPLEPMHKNFALMDRVLHRGEDYLFGLSMFSNRISNFEYMNGENKRGWHTADGMTYLYNDDLSQYSDNYWNTVNPYRLPGTTVDTVSLDVPGIANNADNGQKLFSKQDWVGGSTLGNYGASGMQLSGDLRNQNGTDYSKAKYKSLEAKKSYFMFDDELVCLGAGVNSTEGREIETIIENRKLNEEASNVMTINGEEVVANIGEEAAVEANWAHLEGNTEVGSDIGYYFPSGKTVNVKKVANAGSWGDIKNGDKSPAVTRNYLEMWLSHGTNPVGDTYDYVILPNKSKEQVADYAKKSDIEILINTPDVQAVRENKLGVLSANFWNDEVTTVDKLTVNKKASVTMQEDKRTLEIAVADPTMKNTGTIEVEIDQRAYGVISSDPAVTVTQLAPTIKFTVDVDKAEGKSFNVKFNTKKKFVEEENGNNGIGNGQATKPADKVEEEKEHTHEASTIFTAVEANSPNKKAARETVVTLLEEAFDKKIELDEVAGEKEITRAELAKMVVLAADLEVKEEAEVDFKDIKTGHWATAYIQVANEAGYLVGANGKFRPNDKVTMAELATVLNRVLGKKVAINEVMIEAAKENKIEIKSSHWAFADIMEVSIAHKCVVSEDGVTTWIK